MEYTVYENGHPAEYAPRKCSNSEDWKNSKFPTFEAALIYARQWLGDWAPALPEQWNGEPVVYNGYGDRLEIYPRRPVEQPDGYDPIVQAMIFCLQWMKTQSPNLQAQFLQYCKEHAINSTKLVDALTNVRLTNG